MSETITEYFKRFDNSVTESVYAHYSLEDYSRNRVFNQFLDYDRETLFRKPGQFCGIRNIDNSCYLSVTLQILYNIQGLRERIFKFGEENCAPFMEELQKLFAIMSKGSLLYADPTDLFCVLKKIHPSLFVIGDQNDFHEVFTIVLDELEKSFRRDDDKKFLRKLFYGKTKIQVFQAQKNGGSVGNNDPGNSFNLINLHSENKSLEQALKRYQKQSIEGYVNEKGKMINTEREINFIETPGILSFFINRVSYKDQKLHKDCSEFMFDDKILFNKINLSKVGANSDTELEKQTKTLKQWIQKISKSKHTLTETIAYFESKEDFSDVNIPSIDNTFGDQSRESVSNYLKAELQQIEKKVKVAERDIEDIEKRRAKLAEENYSQIYHIWAVMIHAGKTADSGHYKMCIRVNEQENKWVQFNDRKTEEISSQKINEYKKKGQICCLFYKRSSLTCYSENSPIPSSLKKSVKEKEVEIFKNIDNARLLQALYQEFESANMIWEFDSILLRQQEQVSTYFFKPTLHLLLTHAPAEVCKGYILYEIISSPRFMLNLKDKLLDPSREIIVPKLNFGIPSQYFELNEGIKEFSMLQLISPIEAYDLISFYLDITIDNIILKEMFQKIRVIILLKGIFYENLFVEFGLLSCYKEIKKSIDRIMGGLKNDDPCLIVNISIREAIKEKYERESKDKNCVAKGVYKKVDPKTCSQLKENLSLLFAKRFGYWINLSEKLLEVDESLLKEYSKISKEYMLAVQ